MTTDNLLDYALPEHPSDTIGRLKATGAWPEAERLLRKVKQRHRNRVARNGAPMTTQQRLAMNYAGWQAVQEKWTPPKNARPLASLAEYLRSARGTLRIGKHGLPTLTEEAEQRFSEMGEPNLRGDVVWVYNHLDDANATPLDAPSRGAWSLLAEGRKDRQWFLKTYAAPAARAVRKVADQAQHSDDDEAAIALAREEPNLRRIRAMIAAAVAESQREGV
jgi:hypothetical protein